eukprot:TRINITY_DN501_c0_g1_i1.p1 TRINITY_DN501_c0_g1~~TRINITY_DN501_c0_g1_i1.p1  ORF type:complete len:194 (+),score=23.53 TRINITY_DN501_c0_g1_i1:84-584(+)
MAEINARRQKREGRAANWRSAAIISIICCTGGGASWWIYDQYQIFLSRIIAGLFIAFYGIWAGNGQAIPRPYGRWTEIPLLLICTWTSAHILINPPEKLTSIRAVLLVGHPDPDHPDNQLPGFQETFCHILGIFVAVVNCALLAWRLVFGTNKGKNSGYQPRAKYE